MQKKTVRKVVTGLICLAVVFAVCACAKKEKAAQANGAKDTPVTESAQNPGPADAPLVDAEAPAYGPGSEMPDVIPPAGENGQIPETTVIETKPVSELSKETITGLTEKKWKETTQNIATMRLDKDGNGEFENSGVAFEWSFDKNQVTILIGDRANVEPIYLELKDDGSLVQTNGEAVFEKE